MKDKVELPLASMQALLQNHCRLSTPPREDPYEIVFPLDVEDDMCFEKNYGNKKVTGLFRCHYNPNDYSANTFKSIEMIDYSGDKAYKDVFYKYVCDCLQRENKDWSCLAWHTLCQEELINQSYYKGFGRMPWGHLTIGEITYMDIHR